MPSQVNQDETMTAMESLIVNRDCYLRNREGLAAKSVTRCSAENCVTQHAAIPSPVATGTGGIAASRTRRSFD